MPQSEVLTCIGAPNMVTRNADGCETWIYEKVFQSTTEVYDKHWLFLLVFGRRKGCKHTETSQKKLSVILNFNQNSCLETYSYNSSNF